jgi:hypothetical protein
MVQGVDFCPLMLHTNRVNSKRPMTLTFEQVDALLALIEFHDDWDEVSEIVGANVAELHDILTELRDEVA